MKVIAIAVSCLVAINTMAQVSKSEPATFALGTPSGWTADRKPLALPSYTGIEDTRTSQGFKNPKSEQYWTYASLWYVTGNPAINEETVERQITAYFTSISKNKNSQAAVDNTLPVKSWLTELWGENNDLKTYYGGVAMLDALTQKPISLNCLVHVRRSANATVIFLEVSPKDWDDANWQTLDQLWADFSWENHPYSSN